MTREECATLVEEKYGSAMLADRVRRGLLTAPQALHLVGLSNQWVKEDVAPPEQLDLFAGSDGGGSF